MRRFYYNNNLYVVSREDNRKYGSPYETDVVVTVVQGTKGITGQYDVWYLH